MDSAQSRDDRSECRYCFSRCSLLVLPSAYTLSTYNLLYIRWQLIRKTLSHFRTAANRWTTECIPFYFAININFQVCHRIHAVTGIVSVAPLHVVITLVTAVESKMLKIIVIVSSREFIVDIEYRVREMLTIKSLWSIVCN